MNSQIYCLPQKFGWNAIQGFSKERADEKERYLAQKGKQPFFVMKFNCPDPSPDIREEVLLRNRNLPFPIADAQVRVRNFLWNTVSHETLSSSVLLHSYKPLPPVTYEPVADPPSIKRQYHRPIECVKPPRGTPGNDPDRGLYEWRELAPRPGFGIWQPLEKVPMTNAGERNTLVPPRLKRHNPNHEKERWDNIRYLCRLNALAYGYRQPSPGFAGHKQTIEHILSNVDSQPQNSCWISATRDLMTHFPHEACLDSADRIRHHDSSRDQRQSKQPLYHLVGSLTV